MPPPNPLAKTLHVSVPRQECRWAEQHLEDAVWTSDPLNERLVREHRDVRVLSVSSQDRVELDLLEALPSLEAVITRSTGCDHLPVKGMRELKIDAYHLGGYATESVAHYTLMLLLMLLRRVPEASWSTSGMAKEKGGGEGEGAGTLRPVWDRSALQGTGLQDATVGVLGTGRIGSRLVRILSGLGVRVVGYDVAPDPGLEAVQGFRYTASLQGLLEVSQALTVHVPLDGKTKGMLDAAALDLLPARAVLVNTARGPLIDQEEVAKRLREGRLGGYAADVLPGEPDPPGLVLFQGVPSALLTPHLAAYDTAALSSRYKVTARVTRGILVGETAALREHRVPAEI